MVGLASWHLARPARGEPPKSRNEIPLTLLYRLDIYSDFSMSTTHHAWSAASLALECTGSVDNFKNCTDTTVLPLEYPYNLAEDFGDFDEV